MSVPMFVSQTALTAKLKGPDGYKSEQFSTLDQLLSLCDGGLIVSLRRDPELTTQPELRKFSKPDNAWNYTSGYGYVPIAGCRRFLIMCMEVFHWSAVSVLCAACLPVGWTCSSSWSGSSCQICRAFADALIYHTDRGTVVSLDDIAIAALVNARDSPLSRFLLFFFNSCSLTETS